MKEVTRLTVDDLRACPVWSFTGSDTRGETLVRPIKKLPVKSLAGSVVGSDVVLACGKRVFAMIGNVDVENARMNVHFVTLSFYGEDGTIFHLARYHDLDVSDHGPDQLAAFLHLKKAEVFPISWDISKYARGSADAIRGVILEFPIERLTPPQIIALAVP